jgi:phage terminase small subunit
MAYRDQLTPKQKRFCLLIVEGETQSKAYQLAGYAVKGERVASANASQLLDKPNIQAFIAEQQQQAANRTLVTVESITANLERICANAERAGSFGPAVAAQQVIARLHGLLIEKSEVSVMHRPAPLPTKIIELSEADWIRQFGQGLQEKRLQKLESLDRTTRKIVNSK